MTDEPQHGHLDDLWSWIDHDDSGAEGPEIDPSCVTAVMVVHDAAEWLPRQLLSLARLKLRPGRLIAVDTGSEDGSLPLLQSALAEGVLDEVVETGAEVAFGAAVAQALADSEPDWIWLLHDDSAPHRDALAHLLEGARQADVVVPKLLEPKRRNYPETLSEVGQAITPGGLRVPLVEEGDIDQQQTEARDVLGGSTAGLLIRGDTWRELGGLAPEVERHRDGVDFGWRANAVGFRVMTWPPAALNHLRAGRTGQRPDPEHPHLSDRVAALRVAGARGASGFGLAVSSVLRSAGFLFAKAPGYAGAELRALRRYRATRDETAALAARLPEEDLTPAELLPNRFWPVRHAVDMFGSAVADRYRDLTDSAPDTSIDELTSDEFVRERRRRTISPVSILVVVLLVAAGLAARTLLGGGPIAGGGLLAAPPTMAAAWQAYLTGSAPWLGLAAFSSLAGLGSPGWFAFLAAVLTPLLAAVSALALLRRLEVSLPIAVGASAAWAGGTILLGLVTAGDLTGMVLAVIGPLLVRAVHAVVVNQSAGAERLRAPAGAAFWLIVASCVWPVALVAATIAGIVWGVRRRSRIVEIAIGVLPAWLFLAPWLPTLVRHPGRLLTGADPLAWPDFPPASYAMLVGRILPSGLPVWANIVFFAVLGLAALVAIATLPRRGWLVAVASIAAPLLVGAGLSRLTVAVDGGLARPLLSPWALLVIAALLAPVVWAERDREAVRRPAVIALALSGLLAVGTWAWVGFAGPVQSTTSVLPGYVRDVINSPRDTRAMLVELHSDASIGWDIVDARQPRWGTGERNPIGSYSGQFNAIAQAIAGGAPPTDLAERFRAMGVSHLWLRGFDAEHRSTIDNLEGMVGAAADDDSTVWTVSGLVSRVTLYDGTPVADGQVPPGQQYLILAESPEAGWRASVDGTPLVPTTGFAWTLLDTESTALDGVPAEGGLLQAEPTPHWWHLGLHLIVMAALITLAAPSLGGTTTARRGLE